LLAGSLMVPFLGCGASSADEQRRALTYQEKSDEAAKNGQYGIAGADQRKAQDAHYSAVQKAIDEGKPLPPQPKFGDTPPPPNPP
jgi:hypothetical protein